MGLYPFYNLGESGIAAYRRCYEHHIVGYEKRDKNLYIPRNRN
jgi:hypothetical protein